MWIKTTKGIYLNSDLIEVLLITSRNVAGYNIVAYYGMATYEDSGENTWTIAKFDSKEQAEVALEALVSELK
jgi:hypothetical protein